MRIGVVILPDLRWSTAVERWRDAQSLGFTTAWTYDHLSWRSLRDGPWLGTVPLLAAVAASTSTLRIGTLVTSPNFRHPAVLAKDGMTIDEISGGRLELGIGAGGTGFDAAVFGVETLAAPERAARFEEFVAAIDVLLREPATTFAGRYFTAIESRTFPGCTQQPRVPFTIGAAGPNALRLAARFGAGWVTYGPMAPKSTSDEWFAGVAKQVVGLDAACRAIGREADSIKRIALVGLELSWAQESVGAWDDFCGRIESLGFTDVIVHWPRPEDPELPGVPPAVFDEICRRIK